MGARILIVYPNSGYRFVLSFIHRGLSEAEGTGAIPEVGCGNSILARGALISPWAVWFGDRLRWSAFRTGWVGALVWTICLFAWQHRSFALYHVTVGRCTFCL